MKYMQPPASRNLLAGAGPYYHHALWRYTAEPIFKIDDKGQPIQQWSGEKGIRVRSRFTVDDVIDYFYSRFGIRSPQVRRARLAADRGSVESMLAYASVDQILFAIDALAEDYNEAMKLPPIIAASDYMEEAWERIQQARVILDPILLPFFKEKEEKRKHEQRRKPVSFEAAPAY